MSLRLRLLLWLWTDERRPERAARSSLADLPLAGVLGVDAVFAARFLRFASASKRRRAAVRPAPRFFAMGKGGDVRRAAAPRMVTGDRDDAASSLLSSAAPLSDTSSLLSASRLSS